MHAIKSASLNIPFAQQVIRQHNLLVATWRTGSSFTGDILKSHRHVYYHYEPLLYYGQNLSFEMLPALDHLKQLMLCNYTNMSYYLDFAETKTWVWSFNRQLSPFCKPFPKMCKDEKFMSSVCQIFPIQLIKTVRWPLKATESLLQDPDLNLKTILLVRDPRGIYHSRLKQNWCLNGPECIDIEKMCTRMVEDYEAASLFKEIFPGRMLVIRYEDLVSWPFKTVHKMFQFLNMTVTNEVINYLNRNSVSQVSCLNIK